MTNVTIGQYFPGESALHKMDPRMKIVFILLLMISIFICKSYIALGIVALITVSLVIVSKIKLRAVFSGLKPIMIVVLFTTILNLFYGEGEPVVSFWIFKITQAGLINALFMAARIILLIIQGLMLTYTTSPTALTDAIESLLKPLKLFKVDVHSFAMVMTIALRFIPTLVEELDKIMSAQKSRGADMENGGMISRVKAVVPVIIPLFVSSFRRANELADAMECRCYNGGAGRTKMKVMHLKTRDYLALFFIIIYFTGIVLSRFYLPNVI